MKLIKEVCEPCCKPINIGQPLLECETCRTAIHTKCFKAAGFCSTNSMWICKTCSFNITPRYNPFEQMMNKESDKFYDDDGANDDITLQQISNVLNSCQSYTAQELNGVIPQLSTANSTTQFSTYFINIDGNASNFDTLLAELNRIKHKFSIIGIAETNTDEPLHNLYNIPGYNSFYQNTLEDKCKGTGVALYVANHLNAEVILLLNQK